MNRAEPPCTALHLSFPEASYEALKDRHGRVITPLMSDTAPWRCGACWKVLGSITKCGGCGAGVMLDFVPEVWGDLQCIARDHIATIDGSGAFRST